MGEGLSDGPELIKDYPGYEGVLQHGELSARAILAAHAKGERLGAMVIGQAIEYWGMAVANLVSLFNPEKIIFGGGLFGPATRFIDDIMLEARKWAQPVSFRQVHIESSMLGADAGLYGAAFLALKGKI
jgi:glucokinase